MRVTHSIRGICVYLESDSRQVRGRNFSPSVPIRVHLWLPPSQPSLTTSHWPLATTAPTQYGLIRPNTALNVLEKGVAGKNCLVDGVLFFEMLSCRGKVCRLRGRLTVNRDK